MWTNSSFAVFSADFCLGELVDLGSDFSSDEGTNTDQTDGISGWDSAKVPPKIPAKFVPSQVKGVWVWTSMFDLQKKIALEFEIMTLLILGICLWLKLVGGSSVNSVKYTRWFFS